MKKTLLLILIIISVLCYIIESPQRDTEAAILNLDTVVDSLNIIDGTVSNSDLRDGAVDSNKVIDGGLSGTDFVNPLRYTGDVYITGRQWIKGVKTSGDSLIVLRASSGGTVAWVDTLGKINSDSLNVKGSAYFATTSGNVGIGTTNPLAPFHVAGTNGRFILDASNAQSSGETRNLWRMELRNTSEGDLDFQHWNETTYRPRVTFKANGNIGIGTTSPTATLTVNGINTNGDSLLVLRASYGNTVVSADTTGKVNLAVDPTVATVTAWIDSTNITDDGIGNEDIRINSISTIEIRDATIDSVDVKDGSLSGADLIDDAIIASKIEEEVVDSTHVKDGGIANSDLRNDAVTGGKIQANAIDSTDVNDGSLSGSDLIDDAIIASKIEEEVIDSTHIKDGTVANSDLRNDAVTGSKIQVSTIDSTDVKDGSLSGGDIASGGIGTTQLMSNAVDSTKTKNGSLSISDIANGNNGFQLKESLDDSLFSRYGKEWNVPLPDYCDTTASSLDSTVVKPLADIDATQGMKKYLFVYGNASTAADSTIWLSTFYPHDDNPDSIKTWFAMADSANSSLFIEVRKPDGTILFQSGRITAGATARLYTSAFTSFATLDEHALVYRFVVLNAGDTIKAGQTYFRRN